MLGTKGIAACPFAQLFACSKLAIRNVSSGVLHKHGSLTSLSKQIACKCEPHKLCEIKRWLWQYRNLLLAMNIRLNVWPHARLAGSEFKPLQDLSLPKACESVWQLAQRVASDVQNLQGIYKSKRFNREFC